MAQLGLHGALGLYVASRVGATHRRALRTEASTGTEGGATEKAPDGNGTALATGESRGTKVFKFAYVLGNLLPDVDFFLLGPIYLVNSKIGGSMHRTFSHSLLTIVAVTILVYVLSRSPERRALAVGIGLGMLTHAVVDVLVWFSAVELLWPLNYAGLPAKVNLWANYQPPGWVSNLLGAVDSAAVALFFWCLLKTARRRGTDVAYQSRLAFWSAALLVPSVILGVLSFVLARGLFDIVAYGYFIPFLLPLTLLVTFRMKETIYQA